MRLIGRSEFKAEFYCGCRWEFIGSLDGKRAAIQLSTSKMFKFLHRPAFSIS